MSSWPTLTAPAPQNMEPKPEILLPTEIKLIILKNLSETEVYKMRLMSKAWELAANESFFKDDGRFHLRPHRRNLARLEGLVKTRLFVKNIREINIHIGDFDPKQLLADVSIDPPS